MTAQQPSYMSNLQLELLKLYAHNISEQQMYDIRKMLANYFVQEIDKEMDKLTAENGWTPETIENWGKEHLRRKSA